MGGAGICRGKNNMLGNQFMSMPIAITVEGEEHSLSSLNAYTDNCRHDHFIKNVPHFVIARDQPLSQLHLIF